MAPRQKLELKQSQTLRMTQNMQEAIGLLQIPAVELQAYLEKHLEMNPLLEIENPGLSMDSLDPYEGEGGSEGLPEGIDLTESVYADREDYQPKSATTHQASFWDFTAEVLDESQVILQDLQQQAAVRFQQSDTLKIAEYLIYQLDENGFIRTPIEEIAVDLGCPLENVEAVLKVLKTFDPPGIFSQDLAESFMIQLQRRGQETPELSCILSHLDLVAKYDTQSLQKITGLNHEALLQNLSVLKTLRPYPVEGRLKPVSLRIPDLFVTRSQEGYQVHLNQKILPRVRLNQDYLSGDHSGKISKSDVAYLKSQAREGSWLIQALEKRANTLIRIGQALVNQQQAFFDHGLRYLKPMKLRDIAEQADVHESTVSRIVTGKYLQSPSGIFELKFFFSATAKSAPSHKTFSNKFVQDRLVKLVEEEPKNKPYSDEALVELLLEEGIVVARRTIAKYRDLLRILPSSQRKRHYLLKK